MKITTIMLMLTATLGSAQESRPRKPGSEAKNATLKEAPAEMTGMEIGEKAPALTLKDQDGKDLELAELLKKGPVALVFHRSADW